MKPNLDQLRELLEQRSSELTTVYQELYRETARRWSLEKELKRHREHIESRVKLHNERMEEALTKRQGLKGFIRICSACKKIVNEKGDWHPIEKYIEDRSDATFNHSVCPDCSNKINRADD